MGPGANERSNGFVAFGLLGVVAAASSPPRRSPSRRWPRRSPSRGPRPSPRAGLAAWRAIATPFARAVAIAWRWAVWSTAFESRWRSGRASRRMRQTFLNELGQLVEFLSA